MTRRVTDSRNNADRYISKGRELIKPVVHGVARRALPGIERASGTKYVRERVAGGKGAGKATGASKKIAATTARSYRKHASGLKGTTADGVDGWTVAPCVRDVGAKTRQVTRTETRALLAERQA